MGYRCRTKFAVTRALRKINPIGGFPVRAWAVDRGWGCHHFLRRVAHVTSYSQVRDYELNRRGPYRTKIRKMARSAVSVQSNCGGQSRVISAGALPMSASPGLMLLPTRPRKPRNARYASVLMRAGQNAKLSPRRNAAAPTVRSRLGGA